MSSPKIKPTPKKPDVEPPQLIRWRFYLVLFFVFAIFTALVARIGYIQIIEPDNLIKQGDLPGMTSRYPRSDCFADFTFPITTRI